MVIINLDNGPGATVDAPTKTRVDAARAAGRKVLGYVATQYGNRLQSAIVAEAQQWMTLYGVDGFFVDEMTAECSGEPYIRALIIALKGVLPTGNVVLNPGRNLAECYMASGADAIVNYEGTPAGYLAWVPSPWTASYPATRFWHMFHQVDPSQLATVSQLARRRNAAVLYAVNLPGPRQWEDAFDTTAFATMLALNSSRAPRSSPPVVVATTAPRVTAPPASAAPTTPRTVAPGAPTGGTVLPTGPSGGEPPAAPVPTAPAPGAPAPTAPAPTGADGVAEAATSPEELPPLLPDPSTTTPAHRSRQRSRDRSPPRRRHDDGAVRGDGTVALPAQLLAGRRVSRRANRRGPPARRPHRAGQRPRALGHRRPTRGVAQDRLNRGEDGLAAALGPARR